MKKFFEQMIMDSVSAVKDELLARLADSRNNLTNQRSNSFQRVNAPKDYRANQALRSQQPISKTHVEDFDDDEFPIVAYPDSNKKYSAKISDPTEDGTLNEENNFSDDQDENFENRYDENFNNAFSDRSESFQNKRGTLNGRAEHFGDSNEYLENSSEHFESPINCSRISPVAHRNFLANHESDGEHRISMLNAYNKNRRLNIMILGAVFGLVFCLLMLTFYKGDLPGEVVGIISTVSGIFGSCLKDAYSFEFGSSRGSKEKDDKITSTLLKNLRM